MADMQIIVPASRNVEAQYVELMVPLYSYGCERKVTKTLSHLKGIYSVNVDYYQQKVTVWGICNKYDVLETMKSKRKEARFWDEEDDGNNIVKKKEEEESSSSSHHNKNGFLKPSLALMKAHSLSLNWKAWKKAFTRSFSF